MAKIYKTWTRWIVAMSAANEAELRDKILFTP